MCRCMYCGEVFETWASSYYRNINSCKCRYSKDKRLYSIYTNMKTRCYNAGNPTYEHYGKRGIRMCKEWLDSYKAFEKWAFDNGYEDGLTIERVDVNGNYCPDNCKWITPEEQAANKTTTIRVAGTSLKGFCRDNGLNYKTVCSYHYKHPLVPIEDVVARYI